MTVESINNPLCLLAECPLWNEKEKALYWTDIPNKRIWKHTPQTRQTQIAWQGDLTVGGFAFTNDNSIIICTNKGVHKLTKNPASQSYSQPNLLFDIPMAPDECFNDITTDPKGRIYAGTLTDRRKQGILYKLEKDHPPTPVLHDIGTSNGMTFSLDLKYFYHTDSHIRTISRYDYDLDTGLITNPQVIYEGAPENGSPDGITMDSQGHIWIACYRAGKVIKINTEGRILTELSIPATQVSSLIFGGDTMNELYITTASQGAVDPEKGTDSKGRHLGGEIFKTTLNVTGRKEWPADL